MDIANTEDWRTNRELADIFTRMAGCYRYLGNTERFRAIAYERAARTLAGLPDDISTYATDTASLDRLPNIGEGIAERILEYLQTGHIATWDELQRQVPIPLLDIMEIQGMGPATTKSLHEALGIEDRQDLEDAIRDGRVSKLRGFGPKRLENIRKALKLDKESHGRLRLDTALRIGEDLLRQVRAIPCVIRAELAGSLRRRKETIGDIDILVTCAASGRKSIIRHFTRTPGVSRVLASGDTKASILLASPEVQADLRLVEPEAFGSAFLYLTGSREHNIRLRSLARERHGKINEYGLFGPDGKERLAGDTEASVYQALGLAYIEPELREDRGELDLAARNRLPSLVGVRDMRGDMQMHSVWSDGATDIATLASEALRRFPRYEYIVITDHSPSVRIARGIDPKGFRRQWKEIDRVNADIGRAFVKKGVEVDILADGSLDLPDDVLEGFEWVTASIHSGFRKDNTERLLHACRHRLVHGIGHPSGRLLMKREPYAVDWPAVFRSAAETGTSMEINAQPDRLDLRDDLARQAVAAGVRLTVSTDAHHPSQLDHIHLGISQARRAGCTRENILNTLPWAGVRRFRDAKASSYATR
ncbi:MAG: DNA polymerase/3'-5' exonuclease PolX [Chitinophagia bacterium]|nr:DNA polymerase/3'-5' exonuclease PolX [Chitinophagia bacterium]